MKQLAITAAVALALSACSALPPVPADHGLIEVVATTTVYGDIARQVGGDLVRVVSILENPAQDPHSFEASASVQLAISRARIVVANGGGYDDWAKTLLASSGNQNAILLTAVELGPTPTSTPFNEHVWYDFPTMRRLADELARALATVNPSAPFLANAKNFDTALAALESREATLGSRVAGTGVAITEPVPLYLLQACGLKNVTPPEFSAAIERGTDVSPVVLASTLALFSNRTAALLVYNAQTTGPQTERVLAAARSAGVPVVSVTETLPAGTSYLGWMSATLDAIDAALR